MLFHHIARYAELGCDLSVGKSMNAAEHENLLAAFWQTSNFSSHRNKMLASRNDLFLIRSLACNTQSVFQGNEKRTLPGLSDDCQARNGFRDLIEVSARVFYQGRLGNFQRPQSRLLHRICGVFTILKAVTEEPASAGSPPPSLKAAAMPCS